MSFNSTIGCQSNSSVVYSENWQKPWTNGGGGIASTVRTHLQKHHDPEWSRLVTKNKLKGWDSPKATGPGSSRIGSDGTQHDSAKTPFTVEGFLERLVRWIVVDDQVSYLSQIFRVITSF